VFSELRPADAHDVSDLRDGPTLFVAEDRRSFVLRELRCFDDLIAFGSSGEGETSRRHLVSGAHVA
jgi:hypothetical protein